MFTKAKTKSAIHSATFTAIKKKGKKKQMKTLKVKGKKQLKVSTVAKPKQFMTQPGGVPPQTFQAMIPTPLQKKQSDEAQLMARLRAVTGGIQGR